MKKNCHNCRFLDYHEKEHPMEEAGFSCNKRNYPNRKEETKHLNQLDKDEYRNKGKKCHEPPFSYKKEIK